MAESNFVDYVKIYCRSGKGGRGSMHLRHVSIILTADPMVAMADTVAASICVVIIITGLYYT